MAATFFDGNRKLLESCRRSAKKAACADQYMNPLDHIHVARFKGLVNYWGLDLTWDEHRLFDIFMVI